MGAIGEIGMRRQFHGCAAVALQPETALARPTRAECVIRHVAVLRQLDDRAARSVLAKPRLTLPSRSERLRLRIGWYSIGNVRLRKALSRRPPRHRKRRHQQGYTWKKLFVK